VRRLKRLAATIRFPSTPLASPRSRPPMGCWTP